MVGEGDEVVFRASTAAGVLGSVVEFEGSGEGEEVGGAAADFRGAGRADSLRSFVRVSMVLMSSRVRTD